MVHVRPSLRRHMRTFRFFSGRGNNYVLYLYYIIYGANTLNPRKHHTCKFTTIKIFHSRRRLGRTTPDLCWDRRWRRNRVGSLRKISSGRGETSFPYNTEVTRAQVRRDWTWENSEWSTTEGQDPRDSESLFDIMISFYVSLDDLFYA